MNESSTQNVTAERSRFEPSYFLIRLNGRVWRVCHEANLAVQWPNIEITAGA